ncbi:hypothetical protein PVAND_012817 [Polypedilum vanderplanki]|uniref:Uncharacterized protein n=1 Tax=Polypedilum vanderplanki TaxID=319348 RepID=A0A9J6CNU8_POLVA|nr:hypothetical protein PVAND_012817 [Polypedilum vanderplanki]
MSDEKQKKSEYPCNNCQEIIDINAEEEIEGTTYLKCYAGVELNIFDCKNFVHVECAEGKNLIAANGHYYCQLHKHHPRKPDKNDQNSKQNQQTTQKGVTYELDDSESESDVNIESESESINQTIFNKTSLGGEDNFNGDNTNQMILKMLMKMQKDIDKLKNKKSKSSLPAYSPQYSRKSESKNFDKPCTSKQSDKIFRNLHKNHRNESPIRERSLDDILSSSFNRSQKDTSFSRNSSDVDNVTKQLMELQMLEAKRNISRSLPIINSINYEWKIFYKSFLDTECLFSKTENVRRLQDAIQCDEIKKIGGMSLFSQETYMDALAVIDKKIGRSEVLLLDEKNKLIQQEPLRGNNIKETISFIERVKNYSSLVSKLGNLADKTDSSLIAHISRTLPFDLKNKWRVQYRKIYDEYGTVYLSQMSLWLDTAVADYETDLLFERMDPYTQGTSRSSDNKNQKNFKQKENRKLFLNATSDTENNKQKRENFSKTKSPNNYCWFHDKPGHSSLLCYTLLAKSGKVTDLAKAKNICTFSLSTKGQTSKEIRVLKISHVEKIKKINTNFNTSSSSNEPKKDSKNENESSHNATNNFNACHGLDAEDFAQEPWTVREINLMNYRVNNNSHEKNTIKNPEKYTASTLLPIVVVDLTHNGKNMRCALMLDTGSEVSLLDEKFASFLEAPSINRALSLQWSGGKTRTDLQSGLIKIKAKGVHKNAKSYDIFFRTIKDLGIPDQRFNAKEMKEKFYHLKKLPLESYSKIVGILGQDQNQFLKQIQWIENKRSNKESPIAIFTQLGYAVMGHSCPLEKLYHHLSQVSTQQNLSHKVDKTFLPECDEEELIKMQDSAMGLEFMLPYENDRKIADDVEALAILKREVKKFENKNKYEAPLLWRDKNVTLPTEESLKVALRRLRILINHAMRIGKFDEVKNQIKNLLDKN